MKKYIKYFYSNTIIGNIILSPIVWIYNIYRYRIITEKYFIRKLFKKKLGYSLDIKNPLTFNEKIQWFRLNDRTLLHEVCTDKYKVREYIKNKIGDRYLMPIVFHSSSPKLITTDIIPNYPIIIKTNHSCGDSIIIRDKKSINIRKTQKLLKKQLRSNFYYNFREWQYKKIKPMIIIEKLLLDKNSNIPSEFNFFCTSGKIRFIVAVIDKYRNPQVLFYNHDWELIYYKSSKDVIKNFISDAALKEMNIIVNKLSKDFKFVRVDLYCNEENIYFGELTFSPSAGFELFETYDWDLFFGSKLIIPNNDKREMYFLPYI